MTILYLLIPVVLGMGLVALASFRWSLGAGQYEDLSGAGERILLDIDRGPLRRATAQADLPDAKASLDAKDGTGW
jgi:cbb3-type cytochrome oxidase maturation protein